MESSLEKNQQTMVKMVQELLLGANDKAAVTPAVINEKIDALLTIMPHCREGLDREAVIEELIRRFSRRLYLVQSD